MTTPTRRSPTDPDFGNYRTFPPEYIEVLRRCELLAPSADFRVGPFAKPQALAARRSFYRFKAALNEAAGFGGEDRDEFARELAAIGNNLVLSIAAGQDEAYWLCFRLSPVVAAMRRMLYAEKEAAALTPDKEPIVLSSTV